MRRGTQGLGLFAQACGHCVDHAGDGPEECRVSHHRRDDGSHSDVGIGPRHRVHAFDRRRGNFGGEVEQAVQPFCSISSAPILADRYLVSVVRPPAVQG